MKNLNEVQAQADLLKMEQQKLRRLLANPHLLTVDAVWETEKDFLRVTSEVRALSWVLSQQAA